MGGLRKKNVNKVRALYKIRYSYKEMFFDREHPVFVILVPLFVVFTIARLNQIVYF